MDDSFRLKQNSSLSCKSYRSRLIEHSHCGSLSALDLDDLPSFILRDHHQALLSQQVGLARGVPLRGRFVGDPSRWPSDLQSGLLLHRLCLNSLRRRYSRKGPAYALAANAPLAPHDGAQKAPRNALQRSFAVYKKVQVHWQLYGTGAETSTHSGHSASTPPPLSSPHLRPGAGGREYRRTDTDASLLRHARTLPALSSSSRPPRDTPPSTPAPAHLLSRFQSRAGASSLGSYFETRRHGRIADLVKEVDTRQEVLQDIKRLSQTPVDDPDPLQAQLKSYNVIDSTRAMLRSTRQLINARYQAALETLYKRAGKKKAQTENLRSVGSGGVKVILVAGVFGKTSVAAKIAAALTRVGIGTGMFQWPFLNTIRECISVDGRLITKCEFADQMEAGERKAGDRRKGERCPSSAFFFPPDDKSYDRDHGQLYNLVLSMGLSHFQKKGCQYAVVEVDAAFRWKGGRDFGSSGLVITSASPSVGLMDFSEAARTNRTDALVKLVEDQGGVGNSGMTVLGPNATAVFHSSAAKGEVGSLSSIVSRSEIKALGPRPGETMDEENTRIAQCALECLGLPFAMSEFADGLKAQAPLRFHPLTLRDKQVSARHINYFLKCSYNMTRAIHLQWKDINERYPRLFGGTASRLRETKERTHLTIDSNVTQEELNAREEGLSSQLSGQSLVSQGERAKPSDTMRRLDRSDTAQSLISPLAKQFSLREDSMPSPSSTIIPSASPPSLASLLRSQRRSMSQPAQSMMTERVQQSVHRLSRLGSMSPRIEGRSAQEKGKGFASSTILGRLRLDKALDDEEGEEEEGAEEVSTDESALSGSCRRLGKSEAEGAADKEEQEYKTWWSGHVNECLKSIKHTRPNRESGVWQDTSHWPIHYNERLPFDNLVEHYRQISKDLLRQLAQQTLAIQDDLLADLTNIESFSEQLSRSLSFLHFTAYAHEPDYWDLTEIILLWVGGGTTRLTLVGVSSSFSSAE